MFLLQDPSQWINSALVWWWLPDILFFVFFSNTYAIFHEINGYCLKSCTAFFVLKNWNLRERKCCGKRKTLRHTLLMTSATEWFALSFGDITIRSSMLVGEEGSYLLISLLKNKFWFSLLLRLSFLRVFDIGGLEQISRGAVSQTWARGQLKYWAPYI